MKRSQSQKKISVNDAIKTTQTKISSFFTKLSQDDVNNDKIISNGKALSSSDNKRKAENEISELYTNIKKKCIMSDNDTLKGKTHCLVEPVNIEFCKDSTIKDLENKCNNIKNIKVKSTNTVSEKLDKEGTFTGGTQWNRNSVNTVNMDTSKINNHVLKELQNQDNVPLKSSMSLTEVYDSNKMYNKKRDSQNIEPFEHLSLLDENEFDGIFDQEWGTEINFTALQRCKVIDIRYELRVIILTVQQVETKFVDTVVCSGFWRHIQVKINDIIIIEARKESQQWIVDDNNGLLVTQPDILISGTTIMSALFCNRRAILHEKFRRIELLPNTNGDCSASTIGCLVHQWMQKTLREDVHALSDVIKLLDNILQSKDTVEYLYASEMSLVDCRTRLMEYAPKIFEFIQHYIKRNKQQNINNIKNNFQGHICKIQDIEEGIWLPKLGIKGKIDVTTEVKIHSKRKLMPLELKTGKPSYSLEHRGQVILYLMMMAARYQDIDTGLLLYLKENSMQEIKSTHHERRDIILLRNTLAHYFAKKSEHWWNVTSEANLKMMELPEPINHHSACTKCPYQTLCCAYLTRDPSIKLPASHPLTSLIKEVLDDFNPNHLDYVMKWIMFLQLEESIEIKDNNLSIMWTISPEEREIQGTCICNLKVVGKVVEQDDRYIHTFARINIKDQSVENSKLILTKNDYVIVNTNTQINISTGTIMHISDDVIEVSLDRDVTRQGDHSIFHIDKYLFTTLSTFNYANIAGLLSNDKTIVKLRHIIIDREPATFVEKLSRSIVSTSSRIIGDLNENQQRAVLKAIAANEYVLIKGMPGTGKTQTLVALIELLCELGSTVLITAHTHSAVDNILLKLLDKNVDFIRLGSTKQIHTLLSCKTEEYVTKDCNSTEDLEALYNSKRIVATTCYGAYHTLLRRRTFDVCVIDESTQILQSTILRPLYSARKFILVGDPEQLPPVVKNKTAAKLGANESLFMRLDSDNNTINLMMQYRMNRRIMQLANDITYHGQLVPGNKQIENAVLIGSNIGILSSYETWIRNALSRNLDDSVIVLNTGRTCNLNAESYNSSISSDQIYSNIWEVAIIFRLIQVLKEAEVDVKNIGIIAPYNAHIALLRKFIDKHVEVNTVDQYQGRDKDVILYSCTKSTESEMKNEFEILDDQRRLTVAITRARHKLIIIADQMTLMKYTPFKSLFEAIDERNVINLYDGEEEFDWKNLIQSIL